MDYELITPKTDWKATDHLTYVDWNRIVNNLYFLKELGINRYSDLVNVQLTSAMTDKKEWGWLFAEDLNAVENDLENINQVSAKLDIGTKQTFVAYGKAITYIELNRIESATLELYIEFVNKDPSRRVGTDWILVPTANDIGLI